VAKLTLLGDNRSRRTGSSLQLFRICSYLSWKSNCLQQLKLTDAFNLL